jgi:hypothetical protein
MSTPRTSKILKIIYPLKFPIRADRREAFCIPFFGETHTLPP